MPTGQLKFGSYPMMVSPSPRESFSELESFERNCTVSGMFFFCSQLYYIIVNEIHYRVSLLQVDHIITLNRKGINLDQNEASTPLEAIKPSFYKTVINSTL